MNTSFKRGGYVVMVRCVGMDDDGKVFGDIISHRAEIVTQNYETLLPGLWSVPTDNEYVIQAIELYLTQWLLCIVQKQAKKWGV